MKRTERHHLKENELVSTVARAKEVFETHRRPLVAGLVAVAVIIVGAIAVLVWRSNIDSESRVMLADALETAQTQVVPAAQPGVSTPAPVPPGSYPTERARDEAALAKFMGVANAYPSSSAGITARYNAATLLMALGRGPEALQRYQDVVDRAGNSIYGQMARLGMAQVHAAAGHYDQAIALFKEMAVRKDSQLPVDGILMQLGRACAAAGKSADAKQAFKRIVDEFPLSPYSAEAKKELDTLKG